MTHIFFFGDLRSPFMVQDRDILAEDNNVVTYDMSPYMKMGKIRNIIHPLKCLWNAGNIWRSDLVWCWFLDYPVLPILFLAKIFHKPIVFHIGGWEVYNAPEINYGNQLNVWRGWITRQIMRVATRCIAPTEEYRRVALKLVPECKVVVIPNFVDTTLCDALLPEKERLCVTSLCSENAKPIKGIRYFEDAAKFLLDIRMEVSLHLHKKEYISLLQHAKVYCQLSYSESFGVSLVEAMACGCVPVVTNRDALPWIIQDTGVVVPYGDSFATAQAIQYAMTLDGTKARERARFFSRDKKQAGVRKLIGELCQ